MDTGADCTLITHKAYLKLHQLYQVSFQPCQRILKGVEGSLLNIIGTVLLPVSFDPHDTTFFANFHIVTNFFLQCDALIGFDVLADNDISLHPKHQALSYGDELFYATPTPKSILTVTSKRAHFEQSPLPRVNESPLQGQQPALLANAVHSTCSVSTPGMCAAVVVGDQYISPASACIISVRIKEAPVDSLVVSHPDTSKVKRLALEGTLSSVRKDHITFALVTNLTGSSITLRDGLNLGSFSIYDANLLQDPVTCVAAVSSQPTLTSSPEELEPHLQVMDFPDMKKCLLDLLVKHRKAFALPGEPLGVTNKVQHHIQLKPDSRPVYVPSYRLPHSQRQIAEGLVQDMLKEGIIQESYSPWNSPLLLVKKKDNSYRVVIDFRKVNKVTEPDHYPLPVLSELLQNIGSDNTVFSTLDIKSAFWQIPLSEESRPVTAFSTPTGHYEWLRCPMGLRNSPLTCQRLVNSMFHGLIGKGLFVYMDDLILVSKDTASHLQKLGQVFQKFTQSGLKLNLPKCQFFRSRIEFLGHIVDSQGIHTTSDKIKAIQNFPVPTNVMQVSSFLGLAGYYRSFIKNFASIAHPLNKLKKKNVPFQWNAEQQQSFDQLKTCLTQTPVLAFPDYSLPFTICTDASSYGIGAVLMQQVQGQRPHVIAFASRVLNTAESHYSVTHLEALAVVWALKHFRDIIYNYPITVYTDHSAVTQLFSGKNLTGRLARWFLIVEQFQAEIKYLPGRANLVADALSRNVAIAAVTSVQNFSHQDVMVAQRKDPIWSKVIYTLESGDDFNLPKLPVPLTEFDIQNDILTRKVKVYDREVQQIVIPESLVPTVLRLVHDTPQAGHPGRDKTLAMARLKYYWPKMRLDITTHVSQCVSCAQHKGHTNTAPILEYPTPAGPFETVAIDLMQLTPSRQGSNYVLVCVDYFSRFVVLAPLQNKSANAVAHALVTHLLCPYTTPSVLLSDNGTEFKNEILHNICKQYNITQTFVAVQHPASNGLVERANKKILDVLRHVVSQLNDSWQDWLPHVAASINGSVNASTGKTPHYIIYGTEKRLPYDLLLQPRVPVYSIEDYAKNQLKAFQIIHESVRRNLQASRTEMIQRQHMSATPVTLQVNDVVYKSTSERQSKLHPKFTGPYRVVEKLHGNKFKILCPETNTSEVVHVDRLKKSNVPVSIPSTSSHTPVQTTQPTPVPISCPYNLRTRTGV